MSLRKTQTSYAALLGGAEVAPEAVQPKMMAGPIGDAASREALDKLTRAVAELRDQEVPGLLSRAIRAINGRSYVEGEKLALAALKLDDKQGMAWYVLAVAREKLGDLGSSLRCYDAALQLLADETMVALDLGRLASRLDMPELAIKLYAIYLSKNPSSLEATNNIATSLRDMARFDEAIDVIKPVLTENPSSHILWNTLGTILKNKGDALGSLVFFEESARLKPDFALAHYNRSGALWAVGDLATALEECDLAIDLVGSSSDLDNMKFSKAILLLAAGRLEEGWAFYEARFLPGHSEAPIFIADAPRWTPSDQLAGKHLMVFAEQGVGDEILFANIIPDTIEALGPNGILTLAVERRLQPLFQRSFPTARVISHKTIRLEGRVKRGSLEIENWKEIDFWTPMGSLLRHFRNKVEDFPTTPGFLTPDPERVAHWRGWLDSLPPGPKVGVLWKSMKITGDRASSYSPFHSWGPILQTPGATFINMQYGDVDEELADARERFGVEIFHAPGIDLKTDLDDVAALSAALDVVVGNPNANTQITGAVGTPVWMVTSQASWTQFGTDHYPWFPQVRCFPRTNSLDWSPILHEVGQNLARCISGESQFGRIERAA
ncbi:tetratricopeptide repeat protein [Caulobacter sp. NIBR2454]|uniref:tetratricopeptide repeat protein n=1 Tax=Caulobacter sp. NIBR2454 TaxID=3015996 RepID=UPI0022B661BD|nr:tetratricopeptide repeat protein [Caulobacter sp. NIBR2454]